MIVWIAGSRDSRSHSGSGQSIKHAHQKGLLRATLAASIAWKWITSLLRAGSISPSLHPLVIFYRHFFTFLQAEKNLRADSWLYFFLEWQTAVQSNYVKFDQYLSFKQHVDSIFEIFRPAINAICKLCKVRVKNRGLTLFYKSCIVPLMIYAAPCWVKRIRIDRYQRQCLCLIYQHNENSDSRLDTAGLVNDTTKALHKYIKTGGHFSSRSGWYIPTPTRTSLRSKDLLNQI